MAQYPYYYPQMQMPQMPQMQMQAQQQPQVQTNGLVSVHNEDEARNFPIAAGNSITFKDENAPYIYTKTMGFSQLDRPTFEKYRLVKEDTEPQNEALSARVDNSIIEELRAEIDDVRGQIEALKKKIPTSRKKEVIEDE